MHHVVLIAALSATSGIFGARPASTCPSGTCGAVAAPAQYAAPTQYTAPTQYAAPTGYANGAGYYYYPAAPATYPTATQAPAVAPQYPPVVPQTAVRPPAYTSYYYPPASSCASGTCPRR